MSRTLMLIGAGKMQVPSIRTANEMGLITLVVDFNPDAPGMELADHPITISTRDFEGCVREARKFHGSRGSIDGVITVGTDASQSQAAVAGALQLPGIRFDVAERAPNKVKMRRAFERGAVPQPSYREVWQLGDAEEAAEELGFPLVMKPADNMGGRGVRKLTRPEEIEPAFELAHSASVRGQLIVEEYLEGEEYSTDALFFEGELVHQVIADRIIEREPWFIETGHVLPSQKPREVREQVLEFAENAAGALGITHGAAKGDIKVTPEGPKMIEMAARLSGGFMSGWTYPLATGRSIIKDAIRIALGERPNCPLNPPNGRVAIERAAMAQPGVVRAVRGREALREMTGVEEVFLNRRVGDEIPRPTSNLDKPANVIVTAPRFDRANKQAQNALETLQFEVEPVDGAEP